MQKLPSDKDESLDRAVLQPQKLKHLHEAAPEFINTIFRYKNIFAWSFEYFKLPRYWFATTSIFSMIVLSITTLSCMSPKDHQTIRDEIEKMPSKPESLSHQVLCNCFQMRSLKIRMETPLSVYYRTLNACIKPMR